MMCRLMGINRYSYYSFQNRNENKPVDQNRIQTLSLIQEIAQMSHNTYGSRRIQKALNGLGYDIGRRKTRTLMKEADVFVRLTKEIQSDDR